jgi:hypothetical protein
MIARVQRCGGAGRQPQKAGLALVVCFLLFNVSSDGLSGKDSAA